MDVGEKNIVEMIAKVIEEGKKVINVYKYCLYIKHSRFSWKLNKVKLLKI